MSLVVDGTFMDSGSTRGRPARLTETGGCLRLSWEGGLLEVNGAAVRVSDPIAGVPRRLTLSDGRVFVAPDSAAFATLLRTGGMAMPGRLIAWAEVFRFRLAVILGGLLVALLIGMRWGMPVVTDAAAELVPVSIERLLGEQSLIVLDKTLTKPTTLPAEHQARLTAGFRSLLSAAGLPSDIALEFRSMPTFGPNALALPGGPVILTDALVRLAHNDDEVIAVLAHEVTHLKKRHSLRRVARVMGMSLMIALALGDAGDILQDAAGVPVLLLDHAYSRDFEREADDGAVALLKKTGRDPALLSTMLARLGAVCGDDCAETTWLSTHPGMRDRLKRLPNGSR